MTGIVEQLDTDGDGKISFPEFSIWYLRSEERIFGQLRQFFDRFDFDGSDTLTPREIKVKKRQIFVSVN